MILCDTNILIEFYKNNPQITQELCQLGLSQLAVSVITQAELYALIAATALVHQVELYTLNIKDFHFIPGLNLHK